MQCSQNGYTLQLNFQMPDLIAAFRGGIYELTEQPVRYFKFSFNSLANRAPARAIRLFASCIALS